MKKINPNGVPAFHGELSVRAIDKLPDTAEVTNSVKRGDGSQVVGHSETGHHHVATGGTYYKDTDNPLLAYLVVKGSVNLVHEKVSVDAHKPFSLLGRESGETVWEIGNAREWSPEGWRRSED